MQRIVDKPSMFGNLNNLSMKVVQKEVKQVIILKNSISPYGISGVENLRGGRCGRITQDWMSLCLEPGPKGEGRSF